jgi:serine/threonine-protein kinase
VGYACVLGLGFLAGVVLTIRISLYGSGTTVPPVVGLTLEQAKWQAERAHLGFAVASERFDLQQEKGRVVGQKPGSGMSVRKGMTLSVVVSKGVERLTMPDLTGKRMEAAQLELQQAGLRLAGTAYLHGRSAIPLVTGQSPPVGMVVPRDAEVSLLVDVGPQPPVFVMPDLSGRPGDAARSFLEAYALPVAPLRISRTGAGAPETVVLQDPLPGAPVGRKDLIQLTVVRP